VILASIHQPRLSGQTEFAELCEGNIKESTKLGHRFRGSPTWKTIIGEIILPCVHFDEAFAFTAFDAAVPEIDTLDRPSLAREVDYTATASLVKSMAQIGAEFFIITKRHHHIRDFDRGVFNPDLKLPESSFCAPDLDPIMVAPKVYLP
jgi:hypothetical protein